MNLKDFEINDELSFKHSVGKISSPIGDIKKTKTFINPHLDDLNSTKEIKSVAILN